MSEAFGHWVFSAWCWSFALFCVEKKWKGNDTEACISSKSMLVKALSSFIWRELLQKQSNYLNITTKNKQPWWSWCVASKRRKRRKGGEKNLWHSSWLAVCFSCSHQEALQVQTDWGKHLWQWQAGPPNWQPSLTRPTTRLEWNVFRHFKRSSGAAPFDSHTGSQQQTMGLEGTTHSQIPLGH